MMERLSLNDFQAVANRSLDGDVRIAKGQEGVLVNKGTLGNRLASVFQGVGRAIGLIRPDPSRAQRQEVALERFKEALTSQYGERAATQALQATGLDGADARLTGRSIRDAVSVASEGKQANLGQVAQATLAFGAPNAGNAASAPFRELVNQVKPGLDPDSLSLECRNEYNSRLNKALFQHSGYGKEMLSPDQASRVAARTLKHVLKLEANGLLAGAAQARAAYKDAMKSVLQALAGNQSVGRLGDCLTVANQCFDQLLKAEGYTEAGADEFQDMTMQALIEARTALHAQDPGMPETAQRNALAPEGPMKALMTLVNESLMDVHTTAKMGMEFSRFSRLGTTIVMGLAELMSARHGSVGRDLDTLIDDAPLSEARRAEAETWMAQKADDVLSAERALLAQYAERYESAEKDEQEGVMRQLADAILAEVRQSSGSIENGLEEMRAALSRVPGLAPDFIGKVGEVLVMLATQARQNSESQL